MMTDQQLRAAIIEAVNDGDKHDALHYARRWQHCQGNVRQGNNKTIVALIISIVVLMLFALSHAQSPPLLPPEFEQGVSSSRSVLAAPAEGRSVLAEIDLLPLVHTNIVGCLVFWGVERGAYTNSVQALMPEATVPPTAQMATARISGLDPAVPHYYFAVKSFYYTQVTNLIPESVSNLNLVDYISQVETVQVESDFYPTNGLRWPPLYEDKVAVQVSDDGMKTWITLGVVATGFTNRAAQYRAEAIKTEVP